MRIKTATCILIVLCQHGLVKGSPPVWQYGIGSRLVVELVKPSGRREIWMNYRLAVSVGTACNINLYTNNYYRPNLHIDAVIMKGGIGTREFNLYAPGEPAPRKRAKFLDNSNGFLAGTIHLFQYGTNLIYGNPSLQGKPLYYFSDFTYPVLSNPLKQSVSLGFSYISDIKFKNFQRCANVSFSWDNVSFIYSNDGPPFCFKRLLADEQDRWFTGDGVLNYYNNQHMFNNFEIAYHKFTGWNKYSYETCVDIGATEVNYKYPHQNLFNTNLLSFRGLCTNSPFNIIKDNWLDRKTSCGIGFNIYEWYGMDIQHLIHYKGYYSHHVSPNPFRWSVAGYGQIINQQN